MKILIFLFSVILFRSDAFLSTNPTSSLSLLNNRQLISQSSVSIERINKNNIKNNRLQLNMLDQFFNSFNSGSSSNSNGKRNKSNKQYIVVTGTTSGLGRATAKSLIDTGNFNVICGVRDVNKMNKIAEEDNYNMDNYKVVELDLSSFESTKNFAKKIKSITGSRPLDKLCCNAAVYQPALPTPKWTVDNIEQQLQINHLSHFLLVSLLLPQLSKSKNNPRVCIVGSITGNTNTIGGGLVLPFADLGNLKGMQDGSINPIAMVDGKSFNGAKAYKDSKICNMMTINELHKRYHKSTGVVFTSMYPGCIAETQLFREKRPWFQKLFPLFMKYVTGGYVSEEEAGDRLAQVMEAPETNRSGVYWSWNGGAREIPKKDFKRDFVKGTGGAGGGRKALFENTPSDEVADERKSGLMWEYSTAITGAKWI